MAKKRSKRNTQHPNTLRESFDVEGVGKIQIRALNRDEYLRIMRRNRSDARAQFTKLIRAGVLNMSDLKIPESVDVNEFADEVGSRILALTGRYFDQIAPGVPKEP